MTPAFPELDTLRANPDWASLRLFDRKSWSRVRFGDVVENVNETERAPLEAGIDRFIGLEHLVPQDLHIRSWGNVADGTTFTHRCRPGQFLFGKRRVYQRKVAVAEFDAVVSGDNYVLAPKDERLLPELLPFLCMSDRFFEHAVGTSAGSLSPLPTGKASLASNSTSPRWTNNAASPASSGPSTKPSSPGGRLRNGRRRHMNLGLVMRFQELVEIRLSLNLVKL